MAIVSNVKADLSLNWDDIIPPEDRQRFEEEEQERERREREAQAAKDSAGRKRAAAMVQPGAYEAPMKC
jgi:chromodomain-helicase-DNA-binding protein 1